MRSGEKTPRSRDVVTEPLDQVPAKVAVRSSAEAVAEGASRCPTCFAVAALVETAWLMFLGWMAIRGT